MMNHRDPFLLLCVIATLLSGCTAVSLERHAANQAMSVTDMRYQLVLDNLARMASNSGDLPSFGTASDGSATVTDLVGVDAKTALAPPKNAATSFNGTISRSPQLQWTMDPVHTPDQVRAIQLAYNCVLTGAMPSTRAPDGKLLRDFNAYNDLACLLAHMPGWYGLGCKKEVPKKACYKAVFCNTYVWVAQGGMAGLSEFTLILANIATVDPATLLPIATITFPTNLPGSTPPCVTCCPGPETLPTPAAQQTSVAGANPSPEKQALDAINNLYPKLSLSMPCYVDGPNQSIQQIRYLWLSEPIVLFDNRHNGIQTLLGQSVDCRSQTIYPVTLSDGTVQTQAQAQSMLPENRYQTSLPKDAPYRAPK